MFKFLNDIDDCSHAHLRLVGEIDLSERDEENTPNRETHENFGIQDDEKFDSIIKEVIKEQKSYFDTMLSDKGYSLTGATLLCSRNFEIEFIVDLNAFEKVNQTKLLTILYKWLTHLESKLSEVFKYRFIMMEYNVTKSKFKTDDFNHYTRKMLLNMPEHGMFINNIFNNKLYHPESDDTKPIGYNFYNIVERKRSILVDFRKQTYHLDIVPSGAINFIQNVIVY